MRMRYTSFSGSNKPILLYTRPVFFTCRLITVRLNHLSSPPAQKERILNIQNIYNMYNVHCMQYTVLACSVELREQWNCCCCYFAVMGVDVVVVVVVDCPSSWIRYSWRLDPSGLVLLLTALVREWGIVGGSSLANWCCCCWWLLPSSWIRYSWWLDPNGLVL